MELTEFKRGYIDTVMAIRQSYVAALVASEVLADFPKRLPEAMRCRVITGMRQFAELGLAAVIQAEKQAAAIQAEKFDTPHGVEAQEQDMEIGHVETGEAPGQGDPVTGQVLILLASGLVRKPLSDMDFVPLLYAQCLIATLAHLDGFLNESLKAACRVQPRILRRGKPMTWERALDAGSWDALMTMMTEEYIFEFGVQPVLGRLDHLRSRLGVSIETPAEDLTILEDAYQVRHILVHNGGRVSQEFLTRTQRPDVSLGQLLTVTADYAGWISHQAALVCSDVFVGKPRQHRLCWVSHP